MIENQQNKPDCNMEGIEDSFIAAVADFEQEMVQPMHNNETILFDDDITNALLNGMNDRSNQSIKATDGSRSYLAAANSFLLNQSFNSVKNH